MTIMKKMYFNLHSENMPIYYVQAPNLERYTTTEKDSTKGISRMPPANQRSYDEDLFDIKVTKSNRRLTAIEIDKLDEDGEKDQFETKDELEDKIRRRSKQIRSGFDQKFKLSFEDRSIVQEVNPNQMVEKPAPFQRQRTGPPVKSEDNFIADMEQFHQSEDAS